MPIPRSLAHVQRLVVRTFSAEATVLRKTSVRDDSGGFIDTYTENATYPCSFRRTIVTPREFERDVRTQSIVFWSFSFAVGTDIRNTDRLTVGTRTFEVVAAGENSIPIILDVTAIEVV